MFAGYPSWGWSAEERVLMLEAIAAIEQVSGLRFVDRGDDNDNNVEIWFYNLDAAAADGAYGFSYTPGSGADEGLVAINWSAYRSAKGESRHSIAPGSFHGLTYLHELSHAVGLKHPHDRGSEGQPRFPGLTRGSNLYRDAGLHGQNAQPWTQLTYVDQKAPHGAVPSKAEAFGFLQTPGALDIAALQWMYGINPDVAAGNDVYRLPVDNRDGVGWRSIWDSGGRDRIDASRASAPVTIDLRNATLDLSSSAGGFLSRVQGVYGGFTIAHDWDGHAVGESAGICVIEDATGGRGDDWLIGNAAGNRLNGRRGDDVLYAGAAGPDRLKGGPGRDQFWIAADPGAFVTVADFSPRFDVLVFDRSLKGIEVLAGRDGTDVLIDGVPVAYLAGATEVTLVDHVDVQPFELPSSTLP
ncbi:MAG: M10 family metallopeptidase C-terminal domain-containing protein [Synechococcus sp.]